MPLQGQRFYAVELMIGLPVFIGFCALVADAALPHAGSRTIGIGASIFGLLLLLSGLRQNYVARIAADGTLTFTALTRSLQTRTSDVSRIGVRRGGRGGASYIFYFGGARTALNGIAGRALARSIVALNPGIPHPERL